MSKRRVIIGAGSAVGGMLARLWAERDDRWLSRSDWRVEDGASALAPLLLDAAAVICLAGVTAPPGDFALNAAIGRAVADAAPGAVPVLLFSTMAVYGTSAGPHVEVGPVDPAGAYGQSKLAMEQAVAAVPNVAVLRLSNVVGADLLGRNAATGRSLTIDCFKDGTSPRRSYIDAPALALVLDRLIERAREGETLPKVLNVARAPVLDMADLATAMGLTFETRPAPPQAVPEVSMDLSRLFAKVPDISAPWSAAEAAQSLHGAHA